ncbi:serine/threonine protein kinase [Ralstonia wenshanensis]|uniref:serine/threonine protein kinase n=1 Tax=Ralstonia wenshanensis TaxID=2842456 RepID=UPI0039C689DA
MSDSVDWIVDLDAAPDELDLLSNTVRAGLIERGIIAEQVGAVPAYSGRPLLMRGPRAAEWDGSPVEWLPALCGLEIVRERTVFHTGDNGIQALQCPTCDHQHDPDTVPWSDAVGAWFAGEGDHTFQCPACQHRRSIVDWRFLECEWGFGCLGFGFWNWPVGDRLLQEVSSLLGHRCRLVHQHI